MTRARHDQLAEWITRAVAFLTLCGLIPGCSTAPAGTEIIVLTIPGHHIGAADAVAAPFANSNHNHKPKPTHE